MPAEPPFTVTSPVPLRSSWVVGFQTPLSKQTSRYQVKACDSAALLELIERVRTRVAREVGRPVEGTSCYEAGYDGFWLHRVLEAHGIHNHVLDPASLQVNRRARRPKTDRIDAGGSCFPRRSWCNQFLRSELWSWRQKKTDKLLPLDFCPAVPLPQPPQCGGAFLPRHITPRRDAEPFP
jgi:hypothetical protein